VQKDPQIGYMLTNGCFGGVFSRRAKRFNSNGLRPGLTGPETKKLFLAGDSSYASRCVVED
jgi:hypothetical protein